MASAPEKMAALELTADSARALVQSGRLRELIGVAPNASLEEVRGACKRALFKYHPDKLLHPTHLLGATIDMHIGVIRAHHRIDIRYQIFRYAIPALEAYCSGVCLRQGAPCSSSQ